MNYVSEATASLDFIKSVSKLLEKMKNYKPDMKSLRINYLDKTTEMKLLLKIPQGIRREFRNLEIPAYPGYVIHEVFDGNTFDKIEMDWRRKESNWVADADKLTASDNYFVIMRGLISEAALDELVRLYCPEDPKRTNELDLYWIDSAIKDMAILEKIYDELTIDKVETCVKVGLERQFSSSIPHEVKEWLRAKTNADIYLSSKDRQKGFKSFYRLRLAQRKLGRISAKDIYNISQRLSSPEEFMYFVSVEKPFRIEGLVPLDVRSLYPEKIGVTVLTDLNYGRPVAQGDLIFKKLEFAKKLKEEISSLPEIPKKMRAKILKTGDD
jgi:hypothetical protein